MYFCGQMAADVEIDRARNDRGRHRLIVVGQRKLRVVTGNDKFWFTAGRGETIRSHISGPDIYKG